MPLDVAHQLPAELLVMVDPFVPDCDQIKVRIAGIRMQLMGEQKQPHQPPEVYGIAVYRHSDGGRVVPIGINAVIVGNF